MGQMEHLSLVLFLCSSLMASFVLSGINKVQYGTWSGKGSKLQWSEPELENPLRSHIQNTDFIAPDSGIYKVEISNTMAASAGHYGRIFLVANGPKQLKKQYESQIFEIDLKKNDSIAIWIADHSASGNIENLKLTITWGLRYLCSGDKVCDPTIDPRTRDEISEENLKLIEDINKAAFTWKATRTSLSTVSYAEVLAYWTGQVPTSLEHILEKSSPEENKRTQQFLEDLKQKRQYKENTEVFSTDANSQGGCSSCSAFTVSAAMDTCFSRAISNNSFLLSPPSGLSTQNILDCAYQEGSNGRAGCDGGQTDEYLEWINDNRGSLDTAKKYPYIDANINMEGLDNDEYRQCYQNTERSLDHIRLDQVYHSWDNHTEEDLENILLDGHAIITTMQITKYSKLYKYGIYDDPDCQDWKLGNDRVNQFQSLKPLRHAAVIVGFGQNENGKYWKVKNSWGENWGEAGFFNIRRGRTAHCGVGAYFSVAVCRQCQKKDLGREGCELDALKKSNTGTATHRLKPANLESQGQTGDFECTLKGCPKPKCTCKRMKTNGKRLYCPRNCKA